MTEVLLYGLPLTWAGFNLFLGYGFPEKVDKEDPINQEAPQGEAAAAPTLAARLGSAPAALLYTAGNLLVILGLLAIFFFPASPLPWRAGLWPLLLLAAVNQEMIQTAGLPGGEPAAVVVPPQPCLAPGDGCGL